MGRGAWDNPAYSGPQSPHGTLRICTISSVMPPESQPKKPEDGPQKKAYRTLVSSCCFQICRGIRGTWWEEGSFRILELEEGSQKLWGGRCDLKKRWDVNIALGFMNCLLEPMSPEHRGQSHGLSEREPGAVISISGDPERYVGVSLREGIFVMIP